MARDDQPDPATKIGRPRQVYRRASPRRHRDDRPLRPAHATGRPSINGDNDRRPRCPGRRWSPRSRARPGHASRAVGDVVRGRGRRLRRSPWPTPATVQARVDELVWTITASRRPPPASWRPGHRAEPEDRRSGRGVAGRRRRRGGRRGRRGVPSQRGGEGSTLLLVIGIRARIGDAAARRATLVIGDRPLGVVVDLDQLIVGAREYTGPRSAGAAPALGRSPGTGRPESRSP